jgi:parallel beta-helix repeat protein
MRSQKHGKAIALTVFLAGIIVGALTFHLITANAGDLEPTAPPGPTMKTLDEVEPRIPIPASATPALSIIIDEPGSYYLEGDRKCTYQGIQIEASNVTVDLMGYSFMGSYSGTTAGISIVSGTNIEIRNGTIRDFGYGIYGWDANVKNIRLINLRILTNMNDGIHMTGAGGLIKDCTVSQNIRDGIATTGAGGLIKDCTFSENGRYGIYTGQSQTISGCIVRQNSSIGILAGDGNTILGNTVCSNGGAGIETGNACVISHNTVSDNTGSCGINGGTACTVTYNNQQNSQYGYRIETGSTCVGNVANANERYGFNIFGSLVDQNTAMDNNTAGGYANMNTSGCTLGTNHAP